MQVGYAAPQKMGASTTIVHLIYGLFAGYGAKTLKATCCHNVHRQLFLIAKNWC